MEPGSLCSNYRGGGVHRYGHPNGLTGGLYSAYGRVDQRWALRSWRWCSAPNRSDRHGDLLGILIDNAIVIVENIQGHLDEGMRRMDAMRKAIGELAGPLGASTGTTLAAFAPMLLAKGGAADFTRAYR